MLFTYCFPVGGGSTWVASIAGTNRGTEEDRNGVVQGLGKSGFDVTFLKFLEEIS